MATALLMRSMIPLNSSRNLRKEASKSMREFLNTTELSNHNVFTRKGQIMIPQEIRSEFYIKLGDIVYFSVIKLTF